MGQRNICEDYRMETEEGVMKVLRGYREMNFAKYGGSSELIDLLIDFNDALERAELDAKERAALRTLVTGGRVRNDGKTALDSALRKITEVFREWRYDAA